VLPIFNLIAVWDIGQALHFRAGKATLYSVVIEHQTPGPSTTLKK
jgi:hypothetical protein